jgi:predicted nicotinamide N-methyase
VTKAAVSAGRHVLNLSTGSGVVRIAAAQQRATSVTAFDICPALCSALAPLSWGGRGPSPGRVYPTR